MADKGKSPAPIGSSPDTPDTPDQWLDQPLDQPGHESEPEPELEPNNNDADVPKRIPSLRSVSDPQNPAHSMSATSSPLAVLSSARRPPAATGMSSGRLPEDLNAKMRAFHLSRQASSMSSPPSSSAGSPLPSGASSPGPGKVVMPAGRLPDKLNAAGLQRPGAPAFPHSSPAIPNSGLAGKRKFGLKLGDIGGGAPAGSPISRDAQQPHSMSRGGPSQFKQFDKYIDSEKGYLTFKGKAIITNKGVDFSDGTVFRISLDEVEKLDELGRGNYGTVYKVRHCKPRVPRFGPGLSGFKSAALPGLQASSNKVDQLADGKVTDTSGMVMAMKEIRLELDEAKFATILKELVILHECVSPYIIDFYGAFFQESAVYMCIEYMDGGSIDKLYSGGIPESILRKITYCTVMGLKELKEKHNIIHRDVKPTNILANTRGQVKICDFGVSGNLVASIAKTNIGCQSYMAPERISGGQFMQTGASDGTYSVHSDIWSLGLTIIECAMGKYPYPPEVSSTIFSQLSAIVEGDPPDLPAEGYSETARQFVHSCLNKVPKLRPNYSALLTTEWLKDLSKPETITEEDEEAAENNASAQAVADAADNLDLRRSGTEDPEIAVWVQGVLAKKAAGEYGAMIPRPALHAAPLDAAATSPLASPAVQK